MKISTQIAAILLVSVFVAPTTLIAADYSQSSNVVKFQYKLAEKGHAQAQYRLARMLETGDGIAVDLGEANHWYELASKAGLESATQRKIYLKIKQEGFNTKTDSEWLEGVKDDAYKRKPDAVLLLGELYRQGIGVKKDLNQALQFYDNIRIRGVADVYDDIASIMEEIETNEKAAALRKQQTRNWVLAKEKKKQAQQEKVTLVPSKVSKEKSVKAKASPEQIRAEKLKKYQQVMLQLQREQALIDAQQAETGGDVVSDEI